MNLDLGNFPPFGNFLLGIMFVYLRIGPYADLVYVTLPSHGNFTQTNEVYPAGIWLPSLGTVTKAGYSYPGWVE